MSMAGGSGFHTRAGTEASGRCQGGHADRQLPLGRTVSATHAGPFGSGARLPGLHGLRTRPGAHGPLHDVPDDTTRDRLAGLAFACTGEPLA